MINFCNRLPTILCRLLVGASLLASPVFAAKLSSDMQKLVLPEGFTLSLLTDEVPNARQMALSPKGVLYVGTRRAGKLYAVLPAVENKLPEVKVIADNLTMPSGLTMIGSDLYVGAVDRILRYPNIDQRLQDPPEAELVTASLPDKSHHGWKYLSTGPDGYLYVPVGAPCNICLSDDPVFASIQRVHPGTGKMTPYARGIRNTVGLAWHPDTHNLWFSDNGRDMLGEDVPAEEINQVLIQDSHFGYPFIHAGDIPDPKFGEGKSAENYVPPQHKIQAHSAALGISFYTGDQFPARYKNALFVAEHGSWNRKQKVGYQVSVLRWEGGEQIYETFISGWLEGEKNWGRPNDVLVLPNGDLLISDDAAGAIYRVSYSG